LIAVLENEQHRQLGTNATERSTPGQLRFAARQHGDIILMSGECPERRLRFLERSRLVADTL
jgi:hypothetical protein